jgi:hypothetical protein
MKTRAIVVETFSWAAKEYYPYQVVLEAIDRYIIPEEDFFYAQFQYDIEQEKCWNKEEKIRDIAILLERILVLERFHNMRNIIF